MPEPGQPRILVTGSRLWTDTATIRTALTRAWKRYGRPITVIHGACPTGADPIADTWAREHALHDVHVEAWPADWHRHGRAAGPIRNHAMLDSGITEVLAFPLGHSPGTRGTIRAARARGIPVTDHGRPQIAPTEMPRPSPTGQNGHLTGATVGRFLAGFRPGPRARR